MIPFCPKCQPESCSSECQGAIAKIGVKKVHWECWSKCNLPCRFCYREVGKALNSESGRQLIDAITTGGAKQIVFAGGDPSLRQDLGDLVALAKRNGLECEVQTNGQYVSDEFRRTLMEDVNLVGLSLDGASDDIHDSFRGVSGNFGRVLSLLNDLHHANVPVIVRSVVAAFNHKSLPLLAHVLKQYSNIRRWSLLEFTAIGEGYLNRSDYEIPRTQFDDVVAVANEISDGRVPIDAYVAENKKGTYFMIAPDGRVYGTSAQDQGRYPIVGNILLDHLGDLALRVQFDPMNHNKRYGPVL